MTIPSRETKCRHMQIGVRRRIRIPLSYGSVIRGPTKLADIEHSRDTRLEDIKLSLVLTIDKGAVRG
jgi:hypothetical protein